MLFLIASTGLAALLVGDKLFYRAFYFWIGLTILSYIWARLSLHGIHLVRLLREYRVEVGQYVLETIEVQNESIFPKIWVEIQDQSKIENSISSRVLTIIGRKRVNSYSAFTIAAERGIFDLGPTSIRSGDIFGLFTNEMLVPASSRILITPMIISLMHLDEAHGILQGGKPIRRKSQETTVYSSTIRAYQQGDSLKRVHWPSTVRLGQYMVKEYDHDPQTEVAIFINAKKSTLWYSGKRDKMDIPWILGNKPEIKISKNSIDYISTIACSIANYHLEHGKVVSAFTNDNTWSYLSPDRGYRQINKLLENLAILQGNGEADLGGFVSTQSQTITRGSQVWIISTYVEKNLIQIAEELRERSFVPFVVMIYPEKCSEEEIIYSKEQFDRKDISYRAIIADGRIDSIQKALNS